ncbi:antibiotic biosynthesis monooxygenase [Halopseudomonas pachastrellae]|nr:antibiotic biosynthesis monooxygenase [Halopseudomonas pachastrellae]
MEPAHVHCHEPFQDQARSRAGLYRYLEEPRQPAGQRAGLQELQPAAGPTTEEYTLFASHATWESRSAFEDWTHSEAFRAAHANAGSRREIYLGPPQLECFEVAL